MTEQNFSRPGAFDLSGLNTLTNSTAPASADTAYTLTVTEANFQSTVERSMLAPVLLAFYSPTRSLESARLVEDLAVLSDEFDGKFLLAKVDIDQVPAIAQAMQVPSVPFVALVAQGQPMPMLQNAPSIAELRPMLTQVFQQLLTQGISGRHQPLPVTDAESGEVAEDPRYAAAQDALAAGDIDQAVAEYQKLVTANPSDVEAAAGLAMAKVLQRTQGVDLNAARAAAAANPDEVAAQTLVADLDLLGGHVDDAFNRLIELVRRTSEAERDQARNHLIDLFAAVGNQDERVLRARRNLASALF